MEKDCFQLLLYSANARDYAILCRRSLDGFRIAVCYIDA